MDADRLFEIFRAFLEQLPSLLALIGCLIFAITRWKHHPKIALVVAIGLVILLLHAVVFTFVYNIVPSYFIRTARYDNVQQVIRNVYLVLGWISNSIVAVGFAVLLIGIFMRRKPTGELHTT